eukprot:365303-Chlamydomonas_euryale.AAC.57
MEAEDRLASRVQTGCHRESRVTGVILPIWYELSMADHRSNVASPLSRKGLQEDGLECRQCSSNTNDSHLLLNQNNSGKQNTQKLGIMKPPKLAYQNYHTYHNKQYTINTKTSLSKHNCCFKGRALVCVAHGASFPL